MLMTMIMSIMMCVMMAMTVIAVTAVELEMRMTRIFAEDQRFYRDRNGL